MKKVKSSRRSQIFFFFFSSKINWFSVYLSEKDFGYELWQSFGTNLGYSLQI